MFARITKEDIKGVLRDTGTLISWSSILLIVPILFALFFNEPLENIFNYIVVASFSFTIGLALQKFFKTNKETDLKSALLTTTIVWIIFTFLAALPFTLIFETPIIDAYFETMSALTTTGLSIIQHLDSMPISLIVWRSFLSWIGGIGIIVLALIGVLSTYTKSINLMKAEGRDQQFRPNLKNTVKEIMIIYTILTMIGIGLLWFSGMNFFDSMNYAMSAISTTGMNITQAGLAEKTNPLINLSLLIIMILGAISFSTHYFFIRKKKFNAYLQDKELIIMLVLGIIGFGLVLPQMVKFYGGDLTGLQAATFNIISALTCGGFTLDKPTTIGMWPDFIKIVFIILMIIGGAAGSTAGGIKISRFWLFLKSIFWKIKSIAVPTKSFFQRKFEDRTIEDKQISEIHQFILLYILFIIASTLLLTSQGYNLGTALFEVTSAQSNVGISAGITNHLMPFSTKIILTINMLIGRLEIIPLLSIISFIAGIKLTKR